MSGETVQIGPRIPVDLKRLMDADNRPNREIITEALWREYGGKKKSLVEMQLERKKERKASIRAEREGLAEEEQSLDSEIKALEGRVDTLEDEDEELDSDLDDILDRMEGGEYMWPNAKPVEEIVTSHGLAVETVMDRLKERAAKQDREITLHQFSRKDLPPEAPDVPITEVYDGD